MSVAIVAFAPTSDAGDTDNVWYTAILPLSVLAASPVKHTRPFSCLTDGSSSTCFFEQFWANSLQVGQMDLLFLSKEACHLEFDGTRGMYWKWCHRGTKFSPLVTVALLLSWISVERYHAMKQIGWSWILENLSGNGRMSTELMSTQH